MTNFSLTCSSFIYVSKMFGCWLFSSLKLFLLFMSVYILIYYKIYYHNDNQCSNLAVFSLDLGFFGLLNEIKLWLKVKRYFFCFDSFFNTKVLNISLFTVYSFKLAISFLRHLIKNLNVNLSNRKWQSRKRNRNMF